MVLNSGDINIIADMEGTTGVKLHNNRQKLRNRFDIIRKLGQGTYGKVQLAVNKDTGEEVAIKTIRKSKIETQQDLVRIQREIQIMSSVQHPHIIHIYEVFENKEKIVLVMEYASGGELYDYLSYKKFLEEHEARRVFRQVVAAVYYCHKNMICHRDLKLENILLDEKGNAKIADFGLSNVFDEKNFLNTFCGSPLYASPEIVQGSPYYGPEVDCWSLGVLLYTLVYGAMPFDGSNFKRLVKQISEGDYYEPKELSDASGLIRKMLTVSPTKRANIDDIASDEWVNAGEDTQLTTISQTFCSQMPVRLDYLLALTAGAGEDSQLVPSNELQEEANEDSLMSTDTATNSEMEAEGSTRECKLSESDIVGKSEAEKVEERVEVDKNEEVDVKPEAEVTENKAEPEIPTAEVVQEVQDDIKDRVEPEKGVKRVSSFGKKATAKIPLLKSKTNTEATVKPLAIPSKFGKLKKSGSETEKKPWITPGAKTSPGVKTTSPVPTSPSNKHPFFPKLNRTGSLDKPDVQQPELSKPPIRGNRIGSPVKQFHADTTSNKTLVDSPKQTSPEAKRSPPKTVGKRTSPVPQTRETSPRKYVAKPTQREKESPKRQQIGGTRPKSPVKSVKSLDKVPSTSETGSAEEPASPPKADIEENMGSIDIAPLEVTRKYTEGTEDAGRPLVSFTPKDRPGGFTLLGVKSEVMFDVDDAQSSLPEPKSSANSTVEGAKLKKDNADKIIKYVATVKKHGKDTSSKSESPERVTLLDIKCSTSEDQMSVASSSNSEKSKEQCGYNVYRSKYRSIQKFRSVVEHQIGRVEDTEEEEKLSEGQKKQAEVEHCDSFSSAGSADDLEDVFESLNSETMFTSLLSRTRHLIQRLSSGHIGINASSSGTSSFLFNTPGISLLLTTNGQSQRSNAVSSTNSIGSRRYARSTSVSSQESEQSSSHRRYLDEPSPWERRSRYEDFVASSRAREDPQKELLSTFLRHRNQSLDALRRPRSYYGSATTGCLPGTRDYLTTQEREPVDHYQHHHYSTNSFSRQVSEESVESSSTRGATGVRLQRPRSFLASNSAVNNGSSVHRDYSKNVSKTDGSSYAEEEETKQEQHVSEDKDRRSVVTKKESRRLVSHSESKVGNKDEVLSRQDSGIASMYDANSPTTTLAMSGKPAPIREDVEQHPLAGRRTENEDDDDNSSIHVSDSAETGSIGSDSTSNEHWTNSTSPSHISPSRGCGEESVGDRIRRKSFYARFNESRNPRNKARKQSPGLGSSSAIPSNAHLRHLLESDPFLDSRNNHFDHLHQGDFTHHRPPSQRWSVHLQSPTGSASGFQDTEYFSPGSSSHMQEPPPASFSSGTLPRRSSFTGTDDHVGSGPSMARTHSLPEDSSAPPDNLSSANNTGSLRRPRRLNLYDRNGPAMDEHLTSGRRTSSWRHAPSSTTFRDPMDAWDSAQFGRPNVGNALSSLMDSLESPSEVLQKAMELCDSLRKVK